MKTNLFALVMIFALACFTPPDLKAEGKPNLILTQKVEKQIIAVDEEGKTRISWQETTEADPGDTLKYTIFYTNTGSTEAKNVVINNPVPENTEFKAKSATGDNSVITFSIDGKLFQTPPMLKYRIKKPDGTEEEHQVTPDMYTHIRWALKNPVPTGAEGSLSFMVKVK